MDTNELRKMVGKYLTSKDAWEIVPGAHELLEHGDQEGWRTFRLSCLARSYPVPRGETAIHDGDADGWFLIGRNSDGTISGD